MNFPTLPARRPTSLVRRAGFTVVELAAVSTILIIGVLGTVSAVVAGVRLTAVNREVALAHEAARSMCEKMLDTSFNQIFATYNTDPSDDPGGAGKSPGASFTASGLNSAPGYAAGSIGAIEFPTRKGAGTALTIDETVTDKRWGMPRDVDGDGKATNTAVTSGYLVLPVRIRMTWQSGGTVHTLEFDQVLSPR